MSLDRMAALCGGVLLAFGAGATALTAQGVAPLDEAEEIALARSAAPAAIADAADAWVLREGGYVRAREGTSGAACLVLRPEPGSVVPVCYDPRAARSVLPADLMLHRLRSGGVSAAAADDIIERAFRDGKLTPPVPGAIGWMMSPRQVFIAPTGENIGAWRPHVMIYMPAATPDSTGFAVVGPGDMFLDGAGQGLAHVVIVTANWSDGTAAPGNRP